MFETLQVVTYIPYIGRELVIVAKVEENDGYSPAQTKLYTRIGQNKRLCNFQ